MKPTYHHFGRLTWVLEVWNSQSHGSSSFSSTWQVSDIPPFWVTEYMSKCWLYIYISHAILVISLYQSISFISLPGPTCMLRFTPAPQRNTPVLSHHQEQQPQLTPAAKASSSPTAWFISRWLPSGNLAWPWHFPWHVPQFSRWHSQFSIASGWDFSATFDSWRVTTIFHRRRCSKSGQSIVLLRPPQRLHTMFIWVCLKIVCPYIECVIIIFPIKWNYIYLYIYICNYIYLYIHGYNWGYGISYFQTHPSISTDILGTVY